MPTVAHRLTDICTICKATVTGTVYVDGLKLVDTDTLTAHGDDGWAHKTCAYKVI